MAEQPLRIHIISLGCPKNLVDTEVVCGGLATLGAAIVPTMEEAQVVLINTCSFIRDARVEAEEEVSRALAWREEAPDARWVVVAGCLPQRDLAETRQAFPEVDLFCGLDDVPSMAERIHALVRGERCQQEKTAGFPAPRYLYDHETPRLLTTPGRYAYVKIAEGCDHRCSFCAIPAIRGRQRSRAAASVVRECRNLIEMGVCELNLVAQDATRYGRDRDDGDTLGGLLRELNRLPGTFWIRVLYTHPLYWTDDLVQTFADCEKVVPYVDIPLQHIAQPVLERMGRGLGEDETRRLLTQLREGIPGAIVRTTFLVGFPGERREDFDRLLQTVREYRFDRMGVFVYSSERGTRASRIESGLVSEKTAEARRDLLLRTQQEIAEENNRALIGKRMTVLLDWPEDQQTWTARSVGDAPEVDNAIHVSPVPEEAGPGFAEVRITDAGPYDLEARLM